MKQFFTMDVEQLKSYYIKPSTNKYSIDFILGYKHERTEVDTTKPDVPKEDNKDTKSVDVEKRDTETDRDEGTQNCESSS